LAFAAFVKIDFSSDSFPLALAFVVPKGKPQGLQSEAKGIYDIYESANLLDFAEFCGTCWGLLYAL
jgi:hypothetical protein